MEFSSATTKEQRLPALHRMIDELPPVVRQGFDADWAAGKYDRLDEIIRQVREDLRNSAA